MEFIFIPLIVLAAPVLIILITLGYRARQTLARYRTLLQLADKGEELPPQLLVESQPGDVERRRALVLIGGGLGVMAMFLTLPGEFNGNGTHVSQLWGLGLLPLMTGLGYLASWWFNRRESARG
jgi:hypothetical protein